jgi:hypothetical protein
MIVSYYKRIRMTMVLPAALAPPHLPPGYRFVAWSESLTGVHAAVKFRSFHTELDSHVFPCLGDRYGCLRLMREIRRKPGFLPAATWLISYCDDMCGTIQGVVENGAMGAIQNLGVVPEHRGFGLGRALLLKALHGFRSQLVPRVYLEVTADNDAAIRLYEEIGFERNRVLYKAVEY